MTDIQKAITEFQEKSKKQDSEKLTANITVCHTLTHKQKYAEIQQQMPGFAEVLRKLMATAIDQAYAQL